MVGMSISAAIGPSLSLCVCVFVWERDPFASGVKRKSLLVVIDDYHAHQQHTNIHTWVPLNIVILLIFFFLLFISELESFGRVYFPEGRKQRANWMHSSTHEHTDTSSNRIIGETKIERANDSLKRKLTYAARTDGWADERTNGQCLA